MEKQILVIALGGNAIFGSNIKPQHLAIRSAAKDIAKLVDAGFGLVITHGNGPQVGDAILRSEFSSAVAPYLPLHACVAETQGMLGALIQAAIMERTRSRIACLVTTTLVSKDDRAFANPTKPVGPVYSKQQLHKFRKIHPTAAVREIEPGKFRRVVASPDPISIVESDTIRDLVQENIVIACGGGGIPITLQGKKVVFEDAVVDKDLASERLATAIGASRFVSLTNVLGAYTNFKSRNRRLLKSVDAERMRKLLAAGEFEQGSMEPKVRAAIRFVNNTGKAAVIASLDRIVQAASLKSGTIVYKR